jgi:hypothetical protein
MSEQNEIVLPPEDSQEWYQQQPGESEEAFYARVRERNDRESYLRDYQEYHDVIQAVLASYRADEDGTRLDKQEVTKLVAAWIYDQREQAADEREEELKAESEQSAEEVATSEGWWAKEDTAAAEEEEDY